jgi:hypothetical protein
MVLREGPRHDEADRIGELVRDVILSA